MKTNEDKRLLYQLVISQLQKDGYHTAAQIVSESSLVPFPTQSSIASATGNRNPTSSKEEGDGRLWKIIQLGLQKEREENPNLQTSGITASDYEASGADIVLSPASLIDDSTSSVNFKGLDFEAEAIQAAQTGSSHPRPPYPNYTTKFITTHKNQCRVAKFSKDGRYIATGSADTSIKLLDVSKMKTYNQTKSEYGDEGNMSASGSSVPSSSRPVIRTFYDHSQAINDIEFHPVVPVLFSCSRDCTIKFYDYSQATIKRAFTFIQDNSNVRTISLHPCGDYLLSGTEDPMIRLYDIHTLQSFATSRPQDNHTSHINQVRFSTEGNIFVSCSKDGSIKLWDAISNKVINTIPKPHSGSEVTSVQFSRNQKYLLSGGKDGTIRIWELSTGRQAQHIVASPQWKNRLQLTFSYNEDFIISSDENTYAGIVWDTRSGEMVQKLIGHTNIIPWIASSPVEPAIITCSNDNRGRFWVEEK